MNWGFFAHRVNMPDYVGQDHMGTWNLILLITAPILIAAICRAFRKADEAAVARYLKLAAWFVLALDIVRRGWEIYGDIKYGIGFNWATMLPIFLCSIFVPAVFIAAYGRGQARRCCLGYMVTLGILGGLMNFVMLYTLKTYPFWNLVSVGSILYHFIMVLTGGILLCTGFFRPDWSDIVPAWIPVFICGLVALPVNNIINRGAQYPADYMQLMYGDGIPVLVKISDFFFQRGVGIIFSLLVMLAFLAGSALCVAVERWVLGGGKDTSI